MRRPCVTYQALQKYQEAIVDFSDLCKILPTDGQARCLLVAALYNAQRCDDAEKELNCALKLDPTLPAAILFKSLFLLKRDERQGISLLDDLIKKHPKHAQAYYLKAKYFEDIDPKTSLEAMDRFLLLTPYTSAVSPEEPYFSRGLSLSRLYRTDEALSSYLMAQKLNRRSYKVHCELAATYAQMGKFNTAVHYAEECLRLTPQEDKQYRVYTQMLLAQFLGKAGRTGDAKAAAEKYLSYEKTHALSNTGKAEIHIVLHKYDVALEYYERELKVNSKEFFLLKGMAELLASSPDARVRNGERALQLAKTAFFDVGAVEPQISDAAIVLAEAYAECGDFDTARHYAKKAIEYAGPDFGGQWELSEKLSLFEKKTPYRIKSTK